MKINEILLERVINTFHHHDKLKYSDRVWDILQKSYASISGGFGSASSVEELIIKSGLWKIVVRNGDVTAVAIYKDHYGRKLIAAGTNGSVQGKKDYKMIKTADISLRRAWGEVSGAPERILQKMNAQPVPSKFAAMLTGKEILDYNPDGIHYTRLIMGHPHEKAIYGFFDLTPEQESELIDAGVDLKELPRKEK